MNAAVLALVGAVVLWCAAATQIVTFAHRSASGPADAALVLGAAAWGTRPSPVYRERIEQAIALYRQGRVRWIVLTGGSLVPGEPTEAEVGRRFCVLNGVPAELLVEENQSHSTWENLQLARAEMEPRGIRTVLLVSDPLHMKRAMAMARAQGIAAEPAPTSTSRYRSRWTRSALLWHETWLYLGFELFQLQD